MIKQQLVANLKYLAAYYTLNDSFEVGIDWKEGVYYYKKCG